MKHMKGTSADVEPRSRPRGWKVKMSESEMQNAAAEAVEGTDAGPVVPVEAELTAEEKGLAEARKYWVGGEKANDEAEAAALVTALEALGISLADPVPASVGLGWDVKPTAKLPGRFYDASFEVRDWKDENVRRVAALLRRNGMSAHQVARTVRVLPRHALGAASAGEALLRADAEKASA